MIIKKIMHDQRNDLRDIVDFACYDFPNYQCNNGKCHNITGVYSCRINETNIMNQALLIFLSSQPSSSSPQQAIHKRATPPYNYFSCRHMTVLKVEKTASRWLDFSSASKFPSIPFDVWPWQSWQHDINRFSFLFSQPFLCVFQDLEIWLTQSFFPLELSLFNWQGEKWSQQYMGNGYYGICLCFQKLWWISNLLIFSNIFKTNFLCDPFN